MLKKADIILAIIIITVGIASSLYVSLGGNKTGDQAVIYVDNKLYGSYSLLEDREITLKEKDHLNKITIKEGKVSMSFSNCHSQDCVKQGEIHSPSQSIICLPHKIVIEIESKNNQLDGISS